MATLPSGSGIERTPVTAHASSTAIASNIVSRIGDAAATGQKAVRGLAESEAIEGFVRWAPSAARFAHQNQAARTHGDDQPIKNIGRLPLNSAPASATLASRAPL